MLWTKMGSVAAILGACVLAGCAMSGNRQTATAPSTQAVMCSKCQVTWVKVPAQYGKVTAFTTHKSMVCPDCKSAAQNFFATGKMSHTCKTCGETMELCEGREM